MFFSSCLSCLVLHALVLSCTHLSCLVLSCLVLSCPAGGAKGPFVDYMDRISALGVDMDDYNTMSTAQVRSTS